MTDDVQARIESAKRMRMELSIRAGELKDEYDRAVVAVHRLDGAIAALEELRKDAETPSRP